MKLVYPIILYPMEEHEGGYTVEVPDLPGCVTEGHDLADALDMARDAASGWILDEMEDGRAVPHASNITDVKPDEPDGIVSLDFKTDYIDGDLQQKAERYAPQLHAYAAALSRIFQTPVKKTILYFFSANQPIEI